ncbi:hypothetical protein B0J13DRAFT_680091 [Dactylonectria estremocensis]|uniref:Uncharacterized protein n=1 Tax=Dactylonectria estremocensis TaxID=1079267 RepID=A0A9P9DQZ3_9HYPO|nr:hypothetical protein B0J13DRAFT_680091 [Dactylonectria estremocensis]
MSERLPPVGLEQGSFGQFQLGVAQENPQPRPEPRNQRQEALRKLDECIPKNEDQWQEARRHHGFKTPEDIHRTVSALVRDGPLRSDLQKFIYVAVCCVDRYRGDKAKGYSNYRARVRAENLTEFTIDNYMSLVLGIISLINKLYRTLRHRAFESVLLFAPLGLRTLGHYKQEPTKFVACFPACRIIPEEQASLALYLPFIVKYRHPEYSYQVVCDALRTNVLGEDEYLKFVSVLESNKPIPRILPDPNESQPRTSLSASLNDRGRYDPVRDLWDHNVDLTEHLNTEQLYTVSSPITGFKIFKITESIQKKVAAAGKEQNGCISQEVPGAIIFRFDWSPLLSMAVGLVIHELVQSGILSPGDMHLSRFFFRHDSGPMTVPTGWLKIIVPTTSTTEPGMVTVSNQNVQEDVVWNTGFGILLGQGTTLTTSKTIYYISVGIPTFQE